MDLTFVDGDHSFEYVMQDMANFVPRTEYVIAGHDFNMGKFPGVVFALEHGLKNGTA